MSKNLVYTHLIDLGTSAVHNMHWQGMKLCIETQRLYAERIGADFFCQTERIMELSQTGNDEKFNIYNIFNDAKYDRILCLDADIFIKPDSPDIFKAFPAEDFVYMLSETKYNHQIVMETFIPAIKLVYPHISTIIDKAVGEYGALPYYNVGVILASERHKEIFNTDEYPKHVSYWRCDQDYVNYKIYSRNLGGKGECIPIQGFPLTYNGLYIYDLSSYANNYFIHYAGRNYLKHVFRHCLAAYGDTIDVKKYCDVKKYYIPKETRKEDEVLVGLTTFVSCLPNNCIGAEVNCSRGEATEVLMGKCAKLYAVKDPAHVVANIREAFDTRVGLSGKVIKDIEKDDVHGDLDFVYLNVPTDIQIDYWYKKIKVYGFICGYGFHNNEIEQMVRNKFGDIDGEIFKTFGDGSWMYQKGRRKIEGNFSVIAGIVNDTPCDTIDDLEDALKKIKPDTSPEAVERLKKSFKERRLGDNGR